MRAETRRDDMSRAEQENRIRQCTVDVDVDVDVDIASSCIHLLPWRPIRRQRRPRQQLLIKAETRRRGRGFLTPESPEE